MKNSFIKNQKQRIIALFFLFTFLNTFVPYDLLYANNNGPSSPESAGFESVEATDMVNLTNGDLAYVLPLMSVPSPEGNFPLSLSYHAGVTSDMDASWVGLGWYLNPGAINRTLNGSADDWNGGTNINFISMKESETYYSVSVDVGLPSGASVGVGLNWGGNRGVSGSVSASIGMASASISSTGDMSIGLNVKGISVSVSSAEGGSIGVSGKYGKKGSNTSIGGSLSYSTKNQWKGSGINIRTVTDRDDKGNATSSTGVSLTSSGISVSSSQVGSKGATTSGGASLSQSSFSSGDFSVNVQSQGITLPLQLIGIPVSLGFNKTKVTYSLRKGYKNREWGALYSSNYYDIIDDDDDGGNNVIGELKRMNNQFNDYQSRNRSMDTYEQTLPLGEREFVADTKSKHEKANFTFVAYDDYIVNAEGLSGTLHPKIFQNINIFGKGDNSKSGGTKTHTFFHHGSENDVTAIAKRSIGSNASSRDNLYFYFDGQFTSNELAARDNINLGNGGTLNALVSSSNQGTHANNPYGRAQSPSYIEVFTNKQIKDGDADGLITSTSLPDNQRDDKGKYSLDGIGAYKITSPDGKVYHFSLPVYHYEQVYRTLLNEGEDETQNARHVSEKRQYTKYATHWLLTGITGPDYIDVNNNKKLDEEDYGYWVELDYGKWTDGFVWRTPYTQGVQDYNTNKSNEIEDDDYGYYSFGRKQLYYLDKIKTRTHTALFVKDIRYDAVGQAVKYRFNNINNGFNSDGSTRKYLTPTGDNRGLNKTFSIDVKENNVNYAREYTLKLDKIVLVKNDKAALVSKENEIYSLGKYMTGSPLFYRPDSGHSPQWSSKDFESEYGENLRYQIHQEDNVLDVKDISQDFIRANALEVINLEHDYALAKNSPSSPSIFRNKNTNGGKLTLRKVDFQGKGGASYAPPYEYQYYFENEPNIPEGLNGGDRQAYHEWRKSQLDPWGFIKGDDLVDEGGVAHHRSILWSLKQVKMPTGAKIDIDYERDTYWTEAFARRYWEEDLRFQVMSENDKIVQLKIFNEPGSNINFEDYFGRGDNLYFDLWYYYARKSCSGPFNTFCSWERPMMLNSDVSSDKYNVELKRVESDYIIVEFKNLIIPVTEYPWHVKDYKIGKIFSLTTGATGGGVKTNGRPEQHYVSQGGPLSRHALKYKLLATRVPENETGGGLRVKKLITTASDNERYITTYDYNYPAHIKENTSSGITSYAPVDGLKYVPYQSEVPPPGVMYEYVTVSNEDVDGNKLSSTRYRHNVLKPVIDIFRENISMEAMESNTGREDKIFKANVITERGANNVEAKKIDLHLNTGIIGQLKSIEELNSEQQVIAITENEYINGDYLMNEHSSKSATSESFRAMKSVFKTNESSTSINDVDRYLSISTKTEHNNLLRKVTNHGTGLVKSVTYTDLDPYLGSFTGSESEMSDGTRFKTEKIPAYRFYEGMQAKTENPLNKNMLTQNAMDITSIYIKEGNEIVESWKTIDANVTTWNEDWEYVSKEGTIENGTQESVWRKHKTFVWNGDLTNEGTYGLRLTSNDFNWTINSNQTKQEWEQTSEITRYTHWSTPVETRDVNENYVSSKMADNYSKTIAASNARSSEVFYSGAEYTESVDGQGNSFVSGVSEKTQNQVTNIFHTGKRALKINKGDSDFKVELRAQNSGFNSHRAGKYKLSVWMYETECMRRKDVKLNLDGSLLPFDDEVVEAGSWVQLVKYVDITGADHSISVAVSNNASNNYIYFDDFRLCPISSNMTSYVYDNATDELTAILGANNLATKFRYDKAGRLSKTYSEVVNHAAVKGGFKLVNDYNYNYHNKSRTNENEVDAQSSEQVVEVRTTETPEALDDTYKLEPNETKRFDVLSNDSFGANGAQCQSVRIINSPSSGVLSLDDGGTPFDPLDDVLTYTASSIEETTAATYEICDRQGNCDRGTVVIKVEEYKPVVEDYTVELSEMDSIRIYPFRNVSFGGDGPSSTNPVVINSEPKGKVLNYIRRPIEFALIDNGTPNNKLDDYFSFIPGSGFIGNDTFGYSVCDNDGDCENVTVNLQVKRKLSVVDLSTTFNQYETEYHSVVNATTESDRFRNTYMAVQELKINSLSNSYIENVNLPVKIELKNLPVLYDADSRRIIPYDQVEFDFGYLITNNRLTRSEMFDFSNYNVVRPSLSHRNAPFPYHFYEHLQTVLNFDVTLNNVGENIYIYVFGFHNKFGGIALEPEDPRFNHGSTSRGRIEMRNGISLRADMKMKVTLNKAHSDFRSTDYFNYIPFSNSSRYPLTEEEGNVSKEFGYFTD
ncbi:Ig-like domain-containing protein [Wenyingzhuangia sp. IMCC45533]